MGIHTTASVHPEAQINNEVSIGAFTVIDKNVKIDKGTCISSHVLITGYTTIGKCCRIHTGTIIGDIPQITGYKEEESYVVIGDNNIIRENVTIHRGWHKGNVTKIGNNNFIMVGAHIAHDCQVGDNVTISNNTAIAGHVIIEDNVFISGLVGIHQFVRIGRLSIVGGCSKVVQDVPPYALVDGHPATIFGLNIVGMRRAKISAEIRNILKKAYKILFWSNLSITNGLKALYDELEIIPEVEYLIEFIKNSRKGICKARKHGNMEGI
jgi:UDP-N-acetylglucosamine acyltransferase